MQCRTKIIKERRKFKSERNFSIKMQLPHRCTVNGKGDVGRVIDFCKGRMEVVAPKRHIGEIAQAFIKMKGFDLQGERLYGVFPILSAKWLPCQSDMRKKFSFVQFELMGDKPCRQFFLIRNERFIFCKPFDIGCDHSRSVRRQKDNLVTPGCRFNLKRRNWNV